MPDELDTLGSLITEVKHTMTPQGRYPVCSMADPTGYLQGLKGWTATSSSKTQRRLPTEADLKALLDQLVPRPAPGAPSRESVISALEEAALGTAGNLVVALDGLARLDWPSKWHVLWTIGNRGPGLETMTYLELLEQATRQLPNVDPRVPAAMIAELLRRGGRTINTGALDGWLRLITYLNVLDPLAQFEIMGRLDIPPEAAEGALAMMLAESLDAGLDIFDPSQPDGLPLNLVEGLEPPALGLSAAAPGGWLARLAQLLAGININANTFLDFDKPANMHYGMYFGTQVHLAIANFYQAAHAGHAVWTNVTPIQSILGALQITYAFQGSPLSAALSLARPDIFEFGFQHGMPPGWVYEIKPASEGAGAATASYEVAFYATAMTLCDIPVSPGPAAAVGTEGVVPVPHGWAAFVSPQPGVIVYRIRKASRRAIEVRAQVPVHSDVRDRVERALRATRPVDVAKVGLLAMIIALLLEYGWVVVFI